MEQARTYEAVRMLVTYGHRREPHGVRGCLSEDGMVWNPSNEFVIREVVEADSSIVSSWYHTGYPASIQLKEGTILSVWHEWSKDDPPVQYIVSAKYELVD